MSYAPVPAPYPAPSPAPVPYDDPEETSSSSEEATETESGIDVGAPVPAPAPAPMPVPVPMPMATQQANNYEPYDTSNIVDEEDQLEEHQEQPEPEWPVPTPQQPATELTTVLVEPTAAVEEQPVMNNDSEKQHTNHDGEKHGATLKAAAELIHTLDTAYAKANAENATTALDAEEARSAARTAAEIVRRYTTRSHPTRVEPMMSSFERESSVTQQYRPQQLLHQQSNRAPMTNVQTSTSTFFTPSPAQNSGTTTNMNIGLSASRSSSSGEQSSNNHNNPPSQRFYHPKTPPSAASRIVQAHAEDSLALALELERTKQGLEVERIAHDETKNLLSEEKSRNFHLQQKLQRMEAIMETQRESLGRTGDALEEELDAAVMRMEAAEEDAQLALEFAKESEETREELEQLLQKALEENQSLQELIIANQQQLTIEDGTAQQQSIIMKSLMGDDDTQEQQEEEIISPTTNDGGVPKRRVSFSNTISYSNSPVRGTVHQEVPSEAKANYNHETQIQSSPSGSVSPSTPLGPLVSAGRKLLQRAHGSATKLASDKTYTLDYTPEKSAERRQRLREHLKMLDSDVQIPSPASSAASSDRSPFKQQLQRFGGKNVLETCREVAEALQASGKRLGLDGQWWREKSGNGSTPDYPLDSLARQYCQSVEVSRFHGAAEISLSICSNFAPCLTQLFDHDLGFCIDRLKFLDKRMKYQSWNLCVPF